MGRRTKYPAARFAASNTATPNRSSAAVLLGGQTFQLKLLSIGNHHVISEERIGLRRRRAALYVSLAKLRRGLEMPHQLQQFRPVFRAHYHVEQDSIIR